MVIADIQGEVFGHFVLVDRLAYAHADTVFSLESPSLDHANDLADLVFCRFEQTRSLVCAKLSELGISAGHKSLTGKVRVFELE